MEKAKVLIAEDVPAMQRFYENALSEELFELTLVGEGREAVMAYEKDRPDILVLDMMMPLMSGYAVLNEIRRVKKDTDLTIVMATSKSDEDDVTSCIKLGIQGYIVKPVKITMLEAQLLEALGAKEPEKAAALSKEKARLDRERLKRVEVLQEHPDADNS